MHGAYNYIRALGEGATLQVRRRGDLLRERGYDCVNLGKRDVEGFDLEALAGAEELLAGNRIRAIYSELAFGHGEQIRAYVQGFGYECYLFKASGDVYVPIEIPKHTNGLFLLK